ncbi:hypothetical protein AALP_AA5G001400 [Arabis alpina]|uniref:PB1 domain-containing protein n=1 Tax=Arabis alpina TaxID=50452 RepID=A0A087GTY8_ARAAL|nr:hypothetical protein AALP_AA5G001400 [Arabis alpina]
MEPPPPSLSSSAVASSTVPPSTTTTVPPTSYPESLDSSPRSRTTDGWDDLPAPSGGGSGVSSKLRLMCSYGGHILPRPHDKSLCYMGGDTRIVVVDRNTSLSSLVNRLSNTLLNGRSFTLKYQLPSEDLDSLISVTTDEDLDNMIEEYDRTISNSTKPSRLRLFLFTPKPEATQSMGQILENSAKSDDWFLNALNSAGLLNRGFSDSDTNVNRLLGLDDTLAHCSNSADNGTNRDADGSVKSAKQQQQIQQQPPSSQQPQQQGGGQDVNCLPESPMLDTSSSFGSTSSSPSLANLPPIRVHVEETGGGVRAAQDQRLGIEEQFARINAGNKQQQQQEDGFAAISSPPPPMPVTIPIPTAPATASTEFQTRVFSDDERSDHSVQAGYRKPPTPRSQPQNVPPQQTHQLKSNSGGLELPSPNSVSSDSSMNNPVFHQRPSVYQEPIAQMPSASTVVTGLINPSDPNTLLSQNQNQNQNQDQGYTLHPQFEQQSQPQQQQQQFIHAAAPQYIHHHPSSGLPVQTYIQVYPSQQQPQSYHRHPGQLDQQPYPVYYVTSPVPPRPYSIPVPQPASVSEAPGSLPPNHPQAPPNSTMMAPPPTNHMRSVPPGKPEMGQAAVYTTATGAQMVHQIPASQQQFMAYSQIHHPPQSSAGNPNYGYEYADNAPKQIYYTQPMGHAQYQTMTGPPPAMVMPDGSATPKLHAENLTQQIRSSQPL